MIHPSNVAEKCAINGTIRFFTYSSIIIYDDVPQDVLEILNRGILYNRLRTKSIRMKL